MLYIAGISISVFLFLILLFKKNKSTADFILAAWMGVAVIHQVFFYFIWSGIAFRYPHLLGLGLPLPVLYGVMLYFYVSEITEEKPFTLQFALPHLLPFFLLVVLAIPFFSLSGAEKIRVFENEGRDYLWYQYLQQGFFLVSTIGYTAWSLVLIHKSRRKAQDFFSNTEKRNLRWLEYLGIGLCGICLLVVLFDDAIIFAGVTVLLLLIGLYGINQTTIFQSAMPVPLPVEATVPEETPVPGGVSRYAKSGLKEKEAALLYKQLTLLMHREKLFKNPDLTLAELAKSLDVHPNYLSQVINEREQKNFYNYINTLRIEEFLRLAALPENRRFTLLALAFECGFNSKSTFNKYFKTVTGKTPSEFFEKANA